MLKNLPKHYNPPGNGKRDMEIAGYATPEEWAVLKARGGAGKMTKHGIRSYGLGDKGNSLGSAGGSNWAGNGKGGQVNLDSVGGKTGNVLRNIDGEWRVVSKNPQAQQVSVSRAPVVAPPVQAIPKPIAAPVAAPVAAPIAPDPSIAGRLQAALAAKPSTFPARPSVISSNVARPAVAAPAPSVGFQSSFPARPSVISANVTKSKTVPAGQKVTDVFGPHVDQDPSIAGRLSKPQPVASQASLEARARAVSRGPGAVAGVMPGASPLSQERTLQTLAGSMNEDPRFGGKQFSAKGLQGLAKTISGEAGRESALGQTAVANTMVNRTALAAENPSKYGYMGGLNTNSLMSQYDAAGMRGNLKPNQGFKNAVPGTDALGSGISSLAGALASNSEFNTVAPESIKNATHFYNPATSNPRWGGKNFAKLGNHTFGNAEQTAAQVASLRGQPTSRPTMVASINPTMGPPVSQQELSLADKLKSVVRNGVVRTAFEGFNPDIAAQQPQAETAPSFWEQGKNLVNAGYQTFTDANKKINAAGGGKAVQGLAKLAQMFQGDGSGNQYIGHEQGHGGQGGLKNLPQSSKAKVVPGPTPPAPGFTWVQWTPGSPPTQIPTNALIGAA